VTAGNASGVNDGAAALLIADREGGGGAWPDAHGAVLGMASAGVEPRIMGIGPVDASRKVLDRLGLGIAEMDVIELNEAFAAQALATLARPRGAG
jgi:acetyl-CoA acetyltransferase